MTPRVAHRAFWVLAVASVLVLGWFGRGLTFWSDEWSFIEHRSLGDVGSWFRPFNEHWSTLFVLAYRGLVETVGLRSYVPYLLAVALLNVVVAWLVRRIVERRVGPAGGLAAGGLALFFGAGFENLLWGFQIGFVGALGAGLWAWDRLDQPPSRRAASHVAAALVVSLMTAGVGLFFLAGTIVECLTDPRWRRRLGLVVGPPILLYAAWFITLGRAGVGTFRDPTKASAIEAIPAYLVGGFREAGAAATGLGPGSLVVAAVVLVLAAREVLRRRPVPGRFLAAGAAITTMYVLIALARAGITENGFQYSRYTHVSGLLVLVGLAAFPGPAVAAWVSSGRRASTAARRVAALAVPAVWLTLAMTWNLRLLAEGREIFVDRAAITRALAHAALDPDQPPGADRERWLILLPAPVVLERIVAERGSPETDLILPWAVPPLRPDLVAEARYWLVEGVPTYEPQDID